MSSDVETINRIILLGVGIPALAFILFVIRSKIQEDRARDHGSEKTRSATLDAWLRYGLMCGPVGFIAMFVFLAMDLPPHLPVILISISVLAGMIALGAIILDSISRKPPRR